MLVEVKVPVLSESVAEATLLSWHKKAGEHVDRDANLIDIETDKVVLELPAPATGVLAKIIKNDGATVVGGEIIATIKKLFILLQNSVEFHHHFVNDFLFQTAQPTHGATDTLDFKLGHTLKDLAGDLFPKGEQ